MQWSIWCFWDRWAVGPALPGVLGGFGLWMFLEVVCALVAPVFLPLDWRSVLWVNEAEILFKMQRWMYL